MCNRSRRLFTTSFLPLSPLPFDVPGPSSLIQRASETAGPALPGPAGSPSFCRLGCAASTRSSGPASPQSLINGYSHRSHCFTEGGKSKSNIFHISSALRRIDTDVCSIYPQTCTAERNALRARHSAVPHGCNCPMRQRP